MPKEYIKAKQVMVGSSPDIPTETELQTHLSNMTRELGKAVTYRWGAPITGDAVITPEMQGQTFLITADGELSLPAWADLEEGWWIGFVPNDNFMESAHRVTIALDATDNIRGNFERINGDSVLIRGETPNEFYVVGNAKYVTKDELVLLRAEAATINWWDTWLPNYFPAVPDAIANADAVIADNLATGPEILAAGMQLSTAIANTGLRIAFPCPYELVNGDADGLQQVSSVENVLDPDVNNHIEAIRITLLDGVSGGVVTARQHKVASDTIVTVLGSVNKPDEYLQGVRNISKFNEWARTGTGVVGFEFQNDTVEEVDLSITMKGEVYGTESNIPVRYSLTASIGTEFNSATTTLESVCTLKAEKFVDGVSTGIDEVTSRQAEAYSAGTGVSNVWAKDSFSMGFYYSQNSGKVTFVTQNGPISLDTLGTADISTGVFSTAFPKIDSFGLWQITSTRNGYVRDTGVNVKSNDVKVDFIRQAHAWTLDFPLTTKVNCTSRLWRPKFSEAEIVSVPTSTVEMCSYSSIKLVALLNFVNVPTFKEAETISIPASTLEKYTHTSVKLASLLNPITPPTFKEAETISIPTSTVAKYEYSSIKLVQITQP